MSYLMPRGRIRTCHAARCSYMWYTTFPGMCDCPGCGSPVVDETAMWPHVCPRGHARYFGGPCPQCEVDKALKAAKKAGG